MEDISKLSTQELYAAWGTTREEHLAKMKKFIEQKEAEGRKFIEEYERKAAEAEKAEMVVLAEPAEKQAAAGRPAAAAAAAEESASKELNNPKFVIPEDFIAKLEKQIADLLSARMPKAKRRIGRDRWQRQRKERKAKEGLNESPFVLPVREKPLYVRSKIAAKLRDRGLKHLELKGLESLSSVASEILPDSLVLPEAHLLGKRSAKGKTARGVKAAGKPGIKARAAKGRRGRK